MTTIANSGTCYNLTLIDKVTDYEGNVILDNHAEVKNQVQLASSTWDAVHQVCETWLHIRLVPTN